MTQRKIPLTILLSDETLKQLEANAKTTERSLSATARKLIEKGLGEVKS